MKNRRLLVTFGCALVGLLMASPGLAQADFGLAPGKTSFTAENSDGTIDTQAGSHPYALRVKFQLNVDESGNSEGGELRDVIVDLPPGLIGNPQAVPRCPRQKFEGGTPQCPFETQVGVLNGTVPGFGTAIGPIYNLEPPPGVAAQLGFSLFSFNALLNGSVRTEDGYGLSTFNPNVPINLTVANAEVWGTPAAPGHNADRGRGLPGEPPHSSGAPLLPFLTMPANCAAPLEYTVKVDSKQNPLQFTGETVQSLDAGGNAAALAGCESVPFSPSVSSTPTVTSADTSSGLIFEQTMPTKGLLSPGAIAETESEKTELTLPEGVAVNPSLARGLAACSFAQYKAEGAESLPGQGCPAASKIGTLLSQSPLLEEPVEGSVYVAAPHDNPFDSFMAIYIVARVPERGVVIKQAGEVVADPVTGQLTTVVDHLPPIPVSSLQLKLREGARAPLITPSLCGTYQTQARLYPFSAPNAPVERTVPFTISSGAGGSSCVSNEAQLPNHPALEAGTIAPLAGAYSPFVFKISRSDGDQRFSAIETTLPPGLTAKLAEVPYCSEPQIAAAQARNVEGGGGQEIAQPSCPDASMIGSVDVAAGAGTQPFHAQGKVYLAGPYKGAPLSVVIITPAVAGPFDLGAVVVRAGLYVDESTALVTVKSDPLPTILKGIPLDVRSTAIQVSRNEFTLNPTSCEPMAVSADETSTTGQVASLSNRFQVGGCKALDFTPKLSLSLKGGTRRGSYPRLRAVIQARPGDANIAAVSVALPHSEFLAQEHIQTICTRVQFAARACPAGSVYGHVKATSPLLGYALEGPVYLRSSAHPLPDLVAMVRGPASQPLQIVQVGRVDSVNGGIRTSFEGLPDVPVSKIVLEMQGAKKSLLVNSTDICRSTNRATVRFQSHNDKTLNARPALRVEGCAAKAKKSGGRGKARGSGAGG